MFSNVLKVVRFVTIGCAAIALSVLSAHAQTSPNATTNLKSPARAEQAAAQHKNAHEERLLTDWPDLAKYRESDAAFPPPAPGEDRVVFMGDSITEIWPFHSEYPGTYPLAKDSEFFPGKPYINRGISGQTTPQMLVRFRQDVIDLHPRVVVILAGTNDLAGNTGPESIEDIEGNLKSMSDLAHANGIEVVLCSILPAYDYPWKPGMEPSPKIVALNQWMKSYAAEKGDVYVDYYAAMVDARGGLPSSISIDGVHPNKAGFEIMAPLAEAGIAKALAKPTKP
jgi:lysophospholipase L1-like esterase